MRRLLFLIILLLVGGAAQAAGWLDYLRDLKKKQRPNRRETAIAGVRGWSPEEAAADVDGRDYEGLDRLLRQQPSSADVEAFVREGGLAL